MNLLDTLKQARNDLEELLDLIREGDYPPDYFSHPSSEASILNLGKAIAELEKSEPVAKLFLGTKGIEVMADYGVMNFGQEFDVFATPEPAVPCAECESLKARLFEMQNAAIQLSNAPAVPEGMVLVPIEPPPEMIEAACKAAAAGCREIGIYNRVIAAAPKGTPFTNCKYRICDLPGQCKSEGKCHHPAPAVPEEQWITELRYELMKSKMTHNFTFSRNEVIALLNAAPKGEVK